MKNLIITYLRGFLRAHSKSCRFSLILDIVVVISLLTTLSGMANATDYNVSTLGELPPNGNTDSDTAVITVLDSFSNSIVSITPSSTQIIPGTPFTLTISITPATPITGAQFNHVFESSLATVTSVTEGNLLNQDGASTFFNSGTINNAAGTVTDVYGLILGNTTVSSQGSMANISMTAGYNTGYLDLNLTNVIISDANFKDAPYTLANTTVLIDTAPVLASISARSVDEENELAFTLSASDADGNSLTYYATNLPGGANFNAALGAFSWTPADGQAGTYVVTFGVTDSYLSDSENVTITVNDVNHAPDLMYVSDISISTKTAGINRNAIATVKIVDADNNPVGGATVSGHWTDLTSDTDVGITDANGIVILSSDRVKHASGTFAFIVDNVTHSVFTYNASANIEDQGSIIAP